MNDKPVNEKSLFERKNDFMGFLFCPRCSARLENRVIDGRERRVCGNPSCDYIYYHNPIPAAGAVKNKKLLWVKRAVMPRIGWWCFPAGFMEWTEHPTETAVREVREETGLDIELDSFFEVYVGKDDPRMNAVLMLYLASEKSGKLKAGDDASEVRYFDIDKPPEKIAFESHRRALNDYITRYGGRTRM
jgi:ADP-ribose pyrophosphatase YjhB (NUDIX family)